MKLSLITLLFSFSAFANIDESLFGKIRWDYEVFESEPPSTNLGKSIEKGTPSSRRSENVKVPLENIECFTNIPIIYVSTPSLVDRVFYCQEKGKAKTFSMSNSISCGLTKKNDISKTYIHGNYCESKKNCYGKSYMVIFSCSV